jgi:hypothetical protein
MRSSRIIAVPYSLSASDGVGGSWGEGEAGALTSVAGALGVPMPG